METPVPKIGGKGRRTRKLNTWAKAAGEYYREHKDEYESFSEVLSSPKLKEYYNAKYKNKKGGEGIENANNLVGGKKNRKTAKKRGGNNGGITIDGDKPLYAGEKTALGNTIDGSDAAGGAPISASGGEPVNITDPNATTEPPISGGKKSRKSSKKSKK